VVGRDHRIELAAHRAHENSVGGKRPLNSRGAGGGCEKRRVFVPESAAIAPVRIQRAQGNSRLGDAEPLLQSFARDPGGMGY